MIDLPDFSAAADHEIGFYLTSHPTRLGKLLAHYELYKLVQHLPGAIVECGVFKGASLVRFATLRYLHETNFARQIIGFDSFGPFPKTAYGPDKAPRNRFIHTTGGTSVSTEQLMQALAHKGLAENVELVAGDITQTVPAYAATHPELKIALLHLDVDIYEPSVAVLEHFYPCVVPGGIVAFDDYGSFPGETKAIDDYFAGQQVQFRKPPFAASPTYLIKEP